MANLTKDQREILKALAKRGTMTPLEVSVVTLILPDEVWKHLKSLEEEGYLMTKELSKGIEKEAVILSDRGRKALRSSEEGYHPMDFSIETAYGVVILLGIAVGIAEIISTFSGSPTEAERALFSREDVQRRQEYVNGILQSAAIPDSAKSVALARVIFETGGRDYVEVLIRSS